MGVTEAQGSRASPTTLAELHLPPTFVMDHGIRTLFYQGAMSPVDLGRHWRVHQDAAFELVETLKAAGLVEYEATQTSFERHGKVHLTAAGQERVTTARQRTWYAGPLPVSLADLAQGMQGSPHVLDRDAFRASAAPFTLEDSVLEEIGQAVCAGATVALAGLAHDEQARFAGALETALGGERAFPYALFASGQIVRVFDTRYHRAPQDTPNDGSGSVLRAAAAGSPWASVRRPAVVLSGGIFESDVLPAYDDEARFYLMPAPFAASGGLLSVLSADNSPAGLVDLARLWLVPGRDGTGIIMLRTGERIEVPWRASTLLLCASPPRLPAQLHETTLYQIDASYIASESLRAFVEHRVDTSDAGIELIAETIERAGVSTRSDAAAVVGYVRDALAYLGDAGELTAAMLQQAVSMAQRAPSPLARRDIHAA